MKNAKLWNPDYVGIFFLKDPSTTLGMTKGEIDSIRVPDFSTALRSARNDTGVDFRLRWTSVGMTFYDE